MSYLLENDFVLLCKGHTADEIDKSVTIYKVITSFDYVFEPEVFKQMFNVELGKKIVLPVEYFLTSSWFVGNKPQHDIPVKVKTELIDESSNLLYENIDDNPTINKSNRRFRITSRMFGLTVTTSGLYRYRVTILDHDDKKLGQGAYMFDVNVDFSKQSKKAITNAEAVSIEA